MKPSLTRGFLVPFGEIAPDAVHPVLAKDGRLASGTLDHSEVRHVRS